MAFFCLFFDIFRLKFVDFVFVIFLLAPLSAPSRDFVSYSLVVTCNYVVTHLLTHFLSVFLSVEICKNIVSLKMSSECSDEFGNKEACLESSLI